VLVDASKTLSHRTTASHGVIVKRSRRAQLRGPVSGADAEDVADRAPREAKPKENSRCAAERAGMPPRGQES
jgi:hypothetical protein